MEYDLEQSVRTLKEAEETVRSEKEKIMDFLVQHKVRRYFNVNWSKLHWDAEMGNLRSYT